MERDAVLTCARCLAQPTKAVGASASPAERASRELREHCMHGSLERSREVVSALAGAEGVVSHLSWREFHCSCRLRGPRVQGGVPEGLAG